MWEKQRIIVCSGIDCEQIVLYVSCEFKLKNYYRYHDNATPKVLRHFGGSFVYFRMTSSISATVLGIAAERFSQPFSVTRQLSSSLKPMPHSL